jgi:hypothetical protein
MGALLLHARRAPTEWVVHRVSNPKLPKKCLDFVSELAARMHLLVKPDTQVCEILGRLGTMQLEDLDNVRTKDRETGQRDFFHRFQPLVLVESTLRSAIRCREFELFNPIANVSFHVALPGAVDLFAPPVASWRSSAVSLAPISSSSTALRASSRIARAAATRAGGGASRSDATSRSARTASSAAPRRTRRASVNGA